MGRFGQPMIGISQRVLAASGIFWQINSNAKG
jgi:hypothetical protein